MEHMGYDSIMLVFGALEDVLFFTAQLIEAPNLPSRYSRKKGWTKEQLSNTWQDGIKPYCYHIWGRNIYQPTTFLGTDTESMGFDS